MAEKWRGIWEFAGLLVLSVSLVFVAFQMHQDRKIAAAELNSLQLQMYASGQIAGLESDAYLSMWHKRYATNAWETDGLTNLEIAAAEVAATIWLTYMEMTYEHYREGLVGEKSWLESEIEIGSVLRFPEYLAVFENYWKESPSDFTRKVDELLASE
jgi:hypothetical protein